MQFWSGTAFMKTAEIVAVARMFDEAGYDGIVMSDHMIYPRELSSPYPDSPTGKPGWAPETAWPDSWVLTGAMAAVTRRLRFSNAVYVAPARPLIEVAKLVATASVLSEGRVSLGGGVGWMREEYELMGQDFATRGKRLDEMIPALRELWRGGWVSWSGEYYQVPEMMIEPHPEAPVPILCGGESEAALRRAARLCDGWVGYAYAWDDAVGYAEKLKQLRREYGRENEPFDILLALLELPTPDLYKRAEDVGITAGDVRTVDGHGSAAGRSRALSRTDRAVRRNDHREGAPVNIVGFVANSSDDAVRELVECFYAAIDRRDWSTIEALVSPGWSSRSAARNRSVGTSGGPTWTSSPGGSPMVSTSSKKSSSMVLMAYRDADSPVPTRVSSVAWHRPAPKSRSRGFISIASKATPWARTAASWTCTA